MAKSKRDLALENLEKVENSNLKMITTYSQTLEKQNEDFRRKTSVLNNILNNNITESVSQTAISYFEAKDAYNEGLNIKKYYNKNIVGSPKSNDKWNDPSYVAWENFKGSIPFIGKLLTLQQGQSVLHHNLGQIADDLYRQEINPLLQEEVELEKRVMASDGDYAAKKLKTMEMRRDFWKKELATFKMNKTNKYYEEDVNKLQQLELDIELFKQQQSEFAAKQVEKPEDILFKKLQNYRNIFLLSGKTDDDFAKYREGILSLTDSITEQQPELFNVKRVFYENLEKDFEQIGKDQLQIFKDFQEMIRLYDGGKGALTKEAYFDYLKKNVATGKTSKDGSVQLIGQQSQHLLDLDAEAQKKSEQAVQDELDRNWQAYERYEFHVKQMQLSIYKNGISLSDDSLQKHLKMNDIEYEQQKELVRFQIQDETRKNQMLYQLEEQHLEAALLLEYQYKAKHDPLYAGMQSGFATMWNEFIVGSRRAKNSWDAVWLSIRNSALNKIGSELSDRAMEFMFKKSSGNSGKSDDSNWVDTALSIAGYVLPFLAEGGVVNRPTIAMIGEAGPEAVVPLDQMNSQKIIYVQPIIQGNFDVSMHKLNLKLDQNKQMMEELY